MTANDSLHVHEIPPEQILETLQRTKALAVIQDTPASNYIILAAKAPDHTILIGASPVQEQPDHSLKRNVGAYRITGPEETRQSTIEQLTPIIREKLWR